MKSLQSTLNAIVAAAAIAFGAGASADDAPAAPNAPRTTSATGAAAAAKRQAVMNKARADVSAAAKAKMAASAASAAQVDLNLPAMSAEQLVERNVAAHGGAQAWAAVRTLSISGKMDAGGKDNVQLPFSRKVKRGMKSRLEVPFNGQTAIQVYDGKQGWKLRPFLNRNEVEPFTAAEAAEAKDWDELDGPLFGVAERGVKVAAAGIEAVGDHAAYKLELTRADGRKRLLWLDGKTFLEAKIEGEKRRIDGKMRQVYVLYGDYRSENGLTTARQLETVIDGVAQTRKMHFDQVAVNEDLPDSLFDKPSLSAATRTARQ